MPDSGLQANCKKPHWEEAHVTTAAVKRLQDLPGIKGLTMTAKYPIVEVDYEIPGLPVAVSMEAMTPLIPNDAKNSSFPVAQFAFTVKNTGQSSVPAHTHTSRAHGARTSVPRASLCGAGHLTLRQHPRRTSCAFFFVGTERRAR